MKGKVFPWLSAVAVGLIVAGFIVPPTGVIDPSVLTGVGELFAFAALAQLPEALEKGNRVSLRKGDTSIDVRPRETEEAFSCDGREACPPTNN